MIGPRSLLPGGETGNAPTFKLEEETRERGRLLAVHAPRLVLSFGAFAFGFARRSCDEVSRHAYGYWTVRPRGLERPNADWSLNATASGTMTASQTHFRGWSEESRNSVGLSGLTQQQIAGPYMTRIYVRNGRQACVDSGRISAGPPAGAAGIAPRVDAAQAITERAYHFASNSV